MPSPVTSRLSHGGMGGHLPQVAWGWLQRVLPYPWFLWHAHPWATQVTARPDPWSPVPGLRHYQWMVSWQLWFSRYLTAALLLQQNGSLTSFLECTKVLGAGRRTKRRKLIWNRSEAQTQGAFQSTCADNCKMKPNKMKELSDIVCIKTVPGDICAIIFVGNYNTCKFVYSRFFRFE